MANTAIVDYVFDGDPKQLEELNEVIETATMMESSKYKYDFYNISVLLGINAITRNYDLRGNICDVCVNRDIYGSIIELRMECECAWDESPDLRNKIIKPKFPDVKTYYYVAEPGCEIFKSNDVRHKYFNDRYYIDIEDAGSETCETLAEVKKYIEDNTDITISGYESFESIKDQLEILGAAKDKCFSLNRIAYIED